MRTMRKKAPRWPETPRPDAWPPVEDAVRRYRELHPLYGAFCSHVRQTIAEDVRARSIKIHSIEARTKSVESFERKVRRLFASARTARQAPDPLGAVTDLAGVRVITFFPKTVGEIDAAIRGRFRVLETDNKSEARDASGEFGYRSVHYLVELTAEHMERHDRRWFQGLVAEIQVRTILQHAWAEIEHDIQYKSVRSIPIAIRRRLAAVAGLLEIADREFQAIRDEYERSRKHPPLRKPGQGPSGGDKIG